MILIKIEYNIKDSYAELLLFKEDGVYVKTVLVDVEDIPKILERKWNIRKDGYLYTTYYIEKHKPKRKSKRKNISLHRYVLNMDWDDNRIIDHISRDINDNRKSNLRYVTYKENNCNTSKNLITEDNVPGVKFIENRGYWMVQIKHENKTHHVGTFRKYENAFIVRLKAEYIFNYIINQEYYHLLDDYPELNEISTLEELKKFVQDNKHSYFGEEKKYLKLTPEDVMEIFKLRNTEKLMVKDIAEIFGVTTGHISDVLHGRRCKSFVS